MPLRYHHVLKSIWLEWKRNWCVDHLVHMLVVEFIPDLKMCHKWQELGMHGGDLAKQRCQQILRHAPKTPLTQIRKIDDLHFEVQSLNSNKFHHITVLFPGPCTCAILQYLSPKLQTAITHSILNQFLSFFGCGLTFI